jgi:dihydropteroate synthase
MIWKFRGREIDLSSRGLILGIINVTPDSFSDGGAFLDPLAACDHGLNLLRDGASILDIGGESTRPGALPVSDEEEINRVIPVIRALRAKTEAPISIDTSKAAVAEAAIDAGADIINDVTALRGDLRMPAVAVSSHAGLILMHMQGTPQTMQEAPAYREDDVVTDVAKFLSERREAALGYGVDHAAIILDPGLGFGKTVAHNLALLHNIPLLASLGSPLLIGHSKKSFLAKIAGESAGEASPDRLASGVAVTSFARGQGARLFRVHEPRPHSDALRITEAILAA